MIVKSLISFFPIRLCSAPLNGVFAERSVREISFIRARIRLWRTA